MISPSALMVRFAIVGGFLCATASAQISLTPITTAAQSPVDIVSMRDGKTMLVVEQGGRIMRLASGAYDSTPFLDISSKVVAGGERGLLGIALHPNFTTNNFLYVSYTRRADGATVIARYTRNGVNTADPASEKILVIIDQPYANHNGGGLRFGPDNFLYIGMGDGGSANDPQNRAQDMQSLLGKLLRIDVDRGDPYDIPSDNPFAPNPSAGRPEIFAAGLRNPWRFSFDRENGDLYIGDVGQGAIEEIDLIGPVTTLQFPRTLINFGWRTFEGTHCTNLDEAAACANGRFTPPILEYTHNDGCSVTGGVRYTGSAVAELRTAPTYLFADYCSGNLWRASQGTDLKWTRTLIEKTSANITGFGEDDNGEVYILDHKGAIYKLTSTAQPEHPYLVKSAKEYFNVNLNHYFVTAEPNEQRFVETGGAGAGWQATGQSFTVSHWPIFNFAAPPPNEAWQPVCRFYGRPGVGPNSHFYTSNRDECETVKRDNGWLYEADVFGVINLDANGNCPVLRIPVYRSYNNGFARNDSNHRYTTDLTTHQAMIARGWTNEGVAFCAIQ